METALRTAHAAGDLQGDVTVRVLEVLDEGPASRRQIAQRLSTARREYLDAALQGLSEAGHIDYVDGPHTGHWHLRR
jgi:hypothetical protein